MSDQPSESPHLRVNATASPTGIAPKTYSPPTAPAREFQDRLVASNVSKIISQGRAEATARMAAAQMQESDLSRSPSQEALRPMPAGSPLTTEYVAQVSSSPSMSALKLTPASDTARPLTLSSRATTSTKRLDEAHTQQSGTATGKGAEVEMDLMHHGFAPLGPDPFAGAVGMFPETPPEPTPKWIIMPENPYKSHWDMLVLVVLLLMVFVLPFQLAFIPTRSRDGFDILVDVVFVIDIILTFFTALEKPSGRVVTNQRIIAVTYLRSWFIFDVLSIFPFDFVMDNEGGKLSEFFRIPRLTRALRLVRLRKLFRSSRFHHILLSLEYNPRIHPSVFRIGKMIAVMLAVAHFCACFWFFIGSDDTDDSSVVWTRRVFGDTPVAELPTFSQYITSLYWTITVMTTIGFGDITPRTDAELCFALLVMLCGVVFFSYFTGTLASVVSSQDQTETDYRNKMNSLVGYLNERKDYLAVDMRSKISKHMAFAWSRGQELIADEDYNSIISEMPDSIRRTIAHEFYLFFMQRSPFLALFATHEDFILDFCEQGHSRRYEPFDLIVKMNDDLDTMYFIRDGDVDAVYSNTNRDLPVFQSMHPGGVLGLCSILSPKVDKWPVTYRAASRCALWIIGAREFSEMLAKHGLLDKAMQFAELDYEELLRAKKNGTHLLLQHALTRMGDSAPASSGASFRQSVSDFVHRVPSAILHPLDTAAAVRTAVTEGQEEHEERERLAREFADKRLHARSASSSGPAVSSPARAPAAVQQQAPSHSISDVSDQKELDFERMSPRTIEAILAQTIAPDTSAAARGGRRGNAFQQLTGDDLERLMDEEADTLRPALLGTVSHGVASIASSADTMHLLAAASGEVRAPPGGAQPSGSNQPPQV